MTNQVISKKSSDSSMYFNGKKRYFIAPYAQLVSRAKAYGSRYVNENVYWPVFNFLSSSNVKSHVYWSLLEELYLKCPKQ